MSDLGELYQEIILEHNNKPRNLRKLEGANRTVVGYNPLCGDKMTLYLKLEGDVIVDIGFEGAGCAIFKSSASLMTESVKGKSTAEAKDIFNAVHQMLTMGLGSDLDTDKLGDLEVLSGVTAFPIRIKCATLSWHALHAALEAREVSVSTE